MRRRPWLLILVATVGGLVVVLGAVTGFFVDLVWFDDVGFRSVFWSVLWSKVALGVAFGLAFFGMLLANLVIVRRLSPRYRVLSGPQEPVERYRLAIEPYA